MKELEEHQMVTLTARVVKHNPDAGTAQLLLNSGQWLTTSYENIDGMEVEAGKAAEESGDPEETADDLTDTDPKPRARRKKADEAGEAESNPDA